jgi:hypothetical protein
MYSEQGRNELQSTAAENLLLATSASRYGVDPLVVVSIDQDYRDLGDAGKAQADLALRSESPAFRNCTSPGLNRERRAFRQVRGNRVTRMRTRSEMNGGLVAARSHARRPR